MTTKPLILLAVVGAMLSLTSVVRAQTISNGGLENWGAISTGTFSGTYWDATTTTTYSYSYSYPYGLPGGTWGVSGISGYPERAPRQVAGLTSGSNYGAVIQTGAAYGTLYQTLGGNLSSFKITFDIALSQYGSNRSAQIWIGQSAAGVTANTINLIINGHTTNGVGDGLGLLVRDEKDPTNAGDGVWVSLGSATGIAASGYDFKTGEFSNLNVYRFTIDVANFKSGDGALAYTIAYGTVINDVYSEVYHSESLSHNGSTATTAAGTFLDTSTATIDFLGGFGGATTQTPYIIDNVSVVPEPTALAMMVGGLLLLGGRFARRRA